MKVSRRFTRAGATPYEQLKFVERSTEIRNPDGSVVFRMEGVRVPEGWSQVAVDVLVQKYFRKAGVQLVDEQGNPELGKHHEPVTGAERDARQVFDRLAGCWTHWGRSYGYFDTDEDADAFRDELAYMLAAQIAAPNSPQWFNTGLHWAYGITGPAQGHWYADPVDRRNHEVRERLRAAAAARLLHPVDRRRPRQRGRHHGPVDPRGAAVQVRVRHRHQLLQPARRRASRCRAAASPPD